MEENFTEKLNFPKEDFCKVKLYDFNNTVIDSFNENENFQEENSRIKQNQILIIKKHGCLIIFNSYNIYLLDNENMCLLLEKSNMENKEEENLFYQIQKNKIFLLNFDFKLINVYLDEKEENLFIFGNNENKLNQSIIEIFQISDLIQGKIDEKKSITLNFQIINVKITLNNDFLILNTDYNLLLYDNNLNKKNLLSNNAYNFNYNKKLNSIIFNTEEYIILKNENKNLNLNFPLNSIININEEEIIFLENINNLIIIYTISKINRENCDKLYIILLNENNKISKIFLDEDIFYIDKNDNNGISLNSKEKRAIITLFDENLELYYLLNKQTSVIEKLYSFEKNKEPKIIYLEDDNKIHSLNKTSGENNTFIGMKIIDFEFNNYYGDKEIINGIEYKKPYLFISIGFLGGINLFYLISQKDNLNLVSKNNFNVKFPEKNFEIFCLKNEDKLKKLEKEVNFEEETIQKLNEEIKKLKEENKEKKRMLKIKKKEIKDINEKIKVKKELLEKRNNLKIELKNLIKEVKEDNKNNKKKRKEIKKERKIKIKNTNLQLINDINEDILITNRNLFYQDFIFIIEKNISILHKEIYLPYLKQNLLKLTLKTKNLEKQILNMNFEEFYNKVNIYYEIKEKDEKELINIQKEINEKKDEIYSLFQKKNDIKKIINKFKNINISQENSFEEIFNSEYMIKFFGKEKCNNLIESFNKILLYNDLYKNQEYYYLKLNSIFNKFLKEIEEPNNFFIKYYNYNQLYTKYGKNIKKEKIEFEMKSNNEIVFDYMKAFEKYFYYF